jgi:hypothetical protein
LPRAPSAKRRERDALIFRLFLIGWSHREIAAHLKVNLTHGAVGRTIHARLAADAAHTALFGQQALPSWTESPVVPQPGQSELALVIDASSDGFLSDDQTAFEVIYGPCFVSYEQLFVPPGESVILIPSLEFSSRVQDGYISADFATGEFCVQSPLVQLAYLVVLNSS